MGIDWGAARIGIAISDPTRTIATPHSVLQEKDKGAQIRRVVALAEALEATTLVVGIPYELDGTAGPMAQQVGKFADKLAAVSGREVVRRDESLSSLAAEEAMRAAEGPGARRRGRRKKGGAPLKGRVDKVAAALILQSWLDEQAA